MFIAPHQNINPDPVGGPYIIHERGQHMTKLRITISQQVLEVEIKEEGY